MNTNKIKEDRERIKLEEKENINAWQTSFLNGLHECLSRNTQCTYDYEYLEGDNNFSRWYPFSNEVIQPLLTDIEKSGIDVMHVKGQWPFIKKKIIFTLE